MPFTGTGVFQRVRNWVADAAAGIKIRADYHDAEDDGFAQGLTNCITKDGQTVITQNIPFNNKRITGLADPVNPQDAATKASVGTQISGSSLGLDGGTLTGPLILAGDPTDPLGASTKQYTDAGDAAAQAAAIAAAKAAGDLAYQPIDGQLFAGVPIVGASNYTTVATDAQKCIAGTGTITINAALYPAGTVISFVANGGTMVIANTQTMYWNQGGAALSGNRTLSNVGLATAINIGGVWFISGSGLT